MMILFSIHSNLTMMITDPDLYFYNSTNFNDTAQCNYFDERTFNEADQIKNGRTESAFSMCHLNIRSIRKNLG